MNLTLLSICGYECIIACGIFQGDHNKMKSHHVTKSLGYFHDHDNDFNKHEIFETLRCFYDKNSIRYLLD